LNQEGTQIRLRCTVHHPKLNGEQSKNEFHARGGVSKENTLVEKKRAVEEGEEVGGSSKSLPHVEKQVHKW